MCGGAWAGSVLDRSRAGRSLAILGRRRKGGLPRPRAASKMGQSDESRRAAATHEIGDSGSQRLASSGLPAWGLRMARRPIRASCRGPIAGSRRRTRSPPAAIASASRKAAAGRSDLTLEAAGGGDLGRRNAQARRPGRLPGRRAGRRRLAGCRPHRFLVGVRRRQCLGERARPGADGPARHRPQPAAHGLPGAGGRADPLARLRPQPRRRRARNG